VKPINITVSEALASEKAVRAVLRRPSATKSSYVGGNPAMILSRKQSHYAELGISCTHLALLR
jgi:hypothetical protein